MNEPKDIEAEMKDLFQAASDSVATESAPTEAAVAEAAPAAETATEADTRARDATGKFVKSDAQEKSPEKAEKTPLEATPEAKPAEQAQEQAAVQQPAGEPIRPPSSWSASAKSLFNKLDPVVQHEVMRREDDFHKGIEQYRQGHQQAAEFAQVIQPYMPMIQAEGGTPVLAVQSLLNTAYQIRQDPAGTIGRLIQQFGVDPSQYLQHQDESDPRIQALQNEIQQLKSYAVQGQSQQQQYAKQQEAQINAQADTEIGAFAKDAKNLYFENVRKDMGVLIESGRASDLQDAYDKACWQNPEIRQILLRQQAEVGEKKRIDDAKQKAANAKRAAFDVVGSGSTAAAGNVQMDLEAELRQRYNSTST